MGLEVFEKYECDGQMEMIDCTENKQLTHLSLFSGIGGLDLAAEWAGFKSVGQCEWADYPTKVLEKHWPDVPRWRDIRTLNGASFYERTNRRTVDVISGGFPCQPFSVAGKQRGKDDDRYLWPEMVRVIKELRPSWVVGENVAGIINMALDTVLSDLEAAGYTVRTFVLPACGVNAPHQRYRTAIVGYAEHNGLSPSEITGIITKAGGGEPKGENKTSEFERTSEPGNMPNVGNTNNTGSGTFGNRINENREEKNQGREEQPQPGACGSGEDVAHAYGARCEKFNVSSITNQKGIARGNGHEGYVSDTDNGSSSMRRKPCQGSIGPNAEKWDYNHRGEKEHGIWEWWAAEPGVGRVANGVPNRVDRLKCLGNAVVPAQFYPVFQAIADIELDR